MLRRLVRAYFRIRYFPRLVVELLNGIRPEISRIDSRLDQRLDHLSTEISTIRGGAQWDSSRLRDIHSEISSFCDDATKVLIEHKRQTLEARHRAAEIQTGIDRLATMIAEMKSTIPAEVARSHRDGPLTDLKASQDRAAVLLVDTKAALLDAIAAGLREAGAARSDGEARLTAFLAETRSAIGGQREEITLLRDLVRQQTEAVERLDRLVSQQARVFPSSTWTPQCAERVRSLLALLTPASVPGVPKLRVGRDRDGGYVMLDDFGGIGAALSLGIADDVSWDLDIARRGIRVLQFDPTVAGSPEPHELFTFEPLRIVPHDEPGGVSLETVVRTRIADAGAALLLKIDIESAEWDVLLATDDGTLRRFKQIVCEFHDLDRLGEQAFGARAHDVFARLARTHVVVHVHGNNCANFVNVGNIVVPQSLEVLFVLRAAYPAAESQEVFPTPLDRPNQPGRADLFLGRFRFDAQPDRGPVGALAH